MTLKTEVMMLEIQLYVTGINYNLKYIGEKTTTTKNNSNMIEKL